MRDKTVFYKAVFFDLDGTLVDSHEAHWNAVITTARALGFTIPDNVKEIRHVAGGTYYRFFLYFIDKEKRAGKGWHDRNNLALHYASLAAEAYQRDWIYTVRSYCGVDEMLTRAAGLYEMIGLVTSSDRANVDLTLKHFGWTDHFAVTITKDDVGSHKPHPMPYIQAALRMNVSPRRAIAVEDARVGVFSARLAEMLTIGITTSAPEKSLRESGAHRVVNNHAELVCLLEDIKHQRH